MATISRGEGRGSMWDIEEASREESIVVAAEDDEQLDVELLCLLDLFVWVCGVEVVG